MHACLRVFVCVMYVCVQVPVVTGAGTGSFLFEGSSGLYTEVQPGSYLWMDADYGQNPDTQKVRRD